MTNLATTIESFNPNYHNIDNHSEYRKYSRMESEINTAISGLSHSELVELRTELGDFWSTIFKLDELIKDAAPSRMSTIMTVAHKYYNEGLFPTWTDCLRASHLRYKLLKSLSTKTTSFEYVKSTSEVRQAKGNISAIPTNVVNPKVVKYFDTDANGWRSCRVDRLQSVA